MPARQPKNGLATLAIAGVAALHVVIGYKLYEQRVTTDIPIYGSDFVVFLFPMLMAFLCYAAIFWNLILPGLSPPATKLMTVTAAAAAMTFASLMICVTFAFNRFGT